jgi:hypothetical protein
MEKPKPPYCNCGYCLQGYQPEKSSVTEQAISNAKEKLRDVYIDISFNVHFGEKK